MIIRVNNFIWEHSLLFILFEFSDLYQEVADIFDQLLQSHEGDIGRIVEQLIQDGVLTVSVAIKQVHNTQEQGLIEELSLSE